MADKNGIMVIKLGTEELCAKRRDGTRHLFQPIFENIACQIAMAWIHQGISSVIVSSGAIQAGREALQATGREWQLLEDKDVAGVGSFYLGQLWIAALRLYNLVPGMVWISPASWSNASEKERIIQGIMHYLGVGVVPIINQNDFVTNNSEIDEIMLMQEGISENDQLAARIVESIGADYALFLTAAGAVYESYPVEPGVRRYGEIDAWNLPETIAMSDAKSSLGRGGMAQKVKIASTCRQMGCTVAIASLREAEVIQKFVSGQDVGTMIGESTWLMG